MKFLKLFLTSLATLVVLFPLTAYSADEKDVLTRFDEELLVVMSGFAMAREESASSSFRQEYMGIFDKFLSDASLLQRIVSELGIGEDLNIAVHARNIRNAFQVPLPTAAPAKETKQKDKKKAPATKSNDPIYNLTGRSLSEQIGGSTSTSSQQNQMPAGFSFRMAGNAVQTLSQLGFGLRNGNYSVSSKYRRILPYLELKRDVEYFNVSYEHFDSLIGLAVWRSDFEKRLKRMARLAAQIQPVYRAYFPGKSISVETEANRLSLVYTRYKEYVQAVEKAEEANNRKSNNTAIFDQVNKPNIPDKGLILRDYDTAASKFAVFFADMDSIDWTSNPFSEKGPAGKDGADDDAVQLPAKSSR